MSDSVWHRLQPTRLPRPWHSPGKYTEVGCHFLLQCMKVKSENQVAQSCPTLWDPTDGSPPGSPIPGILQVRTLEWVAISFSNAWKWKWSRSVVSDPQRPHVLQSSRLLCPWDFPGKSTGVGCHCLLRSLSYSQSKLPPRQCWFIKPGSSTWPEAPRNLATAPTSQPHLGLPASLPPWPPEGSHPCPTPSKVRASSVLFSPSDTVF